MKSKIFIMIGLTCLLVACGQTGKLYLPRAEKAEVKAKQAQQKAQMQAENQQQNPQQTSAVAKTS